MSHETTLAVDISEIDKIYATLLWLSDKVAMRLRKYNYHGRTISIKVRASDFSTITRDKTLYRPTDQSKVIYETAKKLLPREYGPRIKIRLLGVRVSHLEKNQKSVQLNLIEDFANNKLSAGSAAIDKIRGRYGSSSIKLAGTKL